MVLAFSFKGDYYQLMSGRKPAATIPRSNVKVLLSSRIGIKAEYSGKVYSLAKIEKPKPKKEGKVKNTIRPLPKKPAIDHPWKRGNSDGFRYNPRDKEIAAGLFNSTIAWDSDRY